MIDPCKVAVFETSPSPFGSNINIDPTIKTRTKWPIKVYTNKERISAAVVCAIKATFTTTYSPATIAEPYKEITIDPAFIVLPNDYGAHPVTVKIESLAYPALVAPVTFSFTLTVLCAVSDFSISSAVTDFSYVLNSGVVTKGPFQAVQTLACKFPVTYTVQRF